MWTYTKVDPKDFGDSGRPFWVLVDPCGKITDRYSRRRDAAIAADDLNAPRIP